jgi:hypothetical protein
VLYGDVPLIRQSTLKDLITQTQKSGVALLSVMLDNPAGYGRIIRKDNQIQAIVEQKDANTEQLMICVPLPAARMIALMLFIIVFYSTMVYNAPSLEICINNNMKTDIHPNFRVARYSGK